MSETAHARWERYRRVVAGEHLPLALVDLDAFDVNVDRLVAPVRAAKKKVRIATKSIRTPALVRRAVERAGDVACGRMTYTAAESALLAAEGFDDLLLAYPVARAEEAALVAEAHATAAARGGRCAVVVDEAAQLDVLERAGARVPVVVEVDVAYRPFARAHVGVRRSPLHVAADVVALASRIARSDHVSFLGVMAYEAQIAGVSDASAPVRLMKRLSRTDVAASRRAVVAALTAAGHAPALVNGGGTGSITSSIAEDALTEIAIGSGFLASHLFDHYRDLALDPAAFFALAVVRRPAPDIVTCHGGGFCASGAAGRDRLPRPVLPEGVRLLGREGAGEVQTPLRVASGVALDLGDPVFFRHAKAGELAEHVNEYLLVRGDRIEARAPTYRGLGKCFLG
jgi:D-serine deaminase-like pyridoxal phosphate-dependent protein